MRRIRRIFCSLVVLATAASTLLANVPLAVCACSPVPVSQNTTSEETAPSSCCCGNNCCPTTSNERSCCTPKPDKKNTTKPMPGSPSAPEQKEVPTNEPALNAPDCQQAVAPTKTFSIEQRHANAGEVVILVHSVAVEPACLTQPGMASPLTWQVHRVPPPTDLVVALQHFVI
jgi:hypothetical protein